ncbi:MAG: hypothetical protein ACTHKS_16125, partial [Gaiellaceae bacterium]
EAAECALGRSRREPFRDRLADRRDERGMRAGARGARERETDALRGLACLDVEVLQDLEVFGDVADRRHHDARGVELLEMVGHVRLEPGSPKRALGRFGPSWDTCAPDCCRPGNGRPSPWDA